MRPLGGTGCRIIMKNILRLIMSGLLGLSGCQATLQFKNYTPPELSIDYSIFEDAGCPLTEHGFRLCNNNSPLAVLDCDEIREPSNLLGGLEPLYPITQCLVEPYRNTERPGIANAAMMAEGKYFYNAGGIIPVYVRYVIFRDGQIHLIKTEEDFRTIFAPIESADEALSYALAVKNLRAYYGLAYDPEYVYFTDTIEDTHVEPDTSGYRVYLFDLEVFGCGPHLTSSVELLVSTDGVIEQVSNTPLFKDPALDGRCVD